MARRLPAVENSIDDIRGKQREVEDTAHVGDVHPVGSGDLGQVLHAPGLDEILPPECPVDGNEDRVLGSLVRGRFSIQTLWHDDLLAAAAPFEGHGDVNDDAVAVASDRRLAGRCVNH